ncbi:MAG: ribosomal protein S18-alanine N-acetyltransferase [Acidimicrobiales bacterium]
MSALRVDELAEPAELVIGPMRRRHLPSVLRIEKQVYPRPWTMGLYLGELSLPSSRLYVVARRANRVCGYGGFMLTLDECHITTVAVDPQLHGGKIGTRLMLVLASRAVARGAVSMTLEVRMSNRPAQELYRKFGFAPAGVRKGYYAEVNEGALVMWAHDIDAPAYEERLAAIEASLPGPTRIERV